MTLEKRVLVPEILDSLPPESDQAVSARASLRRINALMGNFLWLRGRLCCGVGRLWRGEKIQALELGAGDGSLGRFFWSDPWLRRSLSLTGLDQVPRPPLWPAEWGWVSGRIEEFDRWKEYPVVLGNLILHHFSDSELASLGRRLSEGGELLLFSEPLRSPLSLFWIALLSPVCLDPVTRYDARVSIRAGFRNRELPEALGLAPQDWQLRCQETPLGGYRFEAVGKKSCRTTPGRSPEPTV
jgi:hypothetical protein